MTFIIESTVLNVLLCIAISPVVVGMALSLFVINSMMISIIDEYIEHRNIILMTPNALTFILTLLMIGIALGTYLNFIEFIIYERFMNLNK